MLLTTLSSGWTAIVFPPYSLSLLAFLFIFQYLLSENNFDGLVY